MEPLVRFPIASAADVVRAATKDSAEAHNFVTTAFDAVHALWGPASSVRWQREIALAAAIVFFGATRGAGRATLGEELCDVALVSDAGNQSGWKNLFASPRVLLTSLFSSRDGSAATASPVSMPRDGRPRATARWTLILLHTLIPYIFDRWTSQVERDLVRDNPPPKNPLMRFLHENAEVVRQAVSWFQQVHLALFYFGSRFYDIEKRILSLRYVFNREPERGRPTYLLLGLLLLVQLGITTSGLVTAILTRLRQRVRRKRDTITGGTAQETDIATEVTSSRRGETGEADVAAKVAEAPKVAVMLPGGDDAPACTLCLEPRRHPTATRCGHVFCWQCIAEWCAGGSPVCPLCRQGVEVRELLPLFGVS